MSRESPGTPIPSLDFRPSPWSESSLRGSRSVSRCPGSNRKRLTGFVAVGTGVVQDFFNQFKRQIRQTNIVIRRVVLHGNNRLTGMLAFNDIQAPHLPKISKSGSKFTEEVNVWLAEAC